MVKIKIIEKNLIDDKNVKIFLKCKTKENTCFDFEIFEDGKSTGQETIVSNNNGIFVLERNILPASKKITIYNKTLKEKFVSFSTSITKRKYLKVLKKIFFPFIKVFSFLGRQINFFWTEYHFLVPLSVWGNFFSYIYMNIKSRVFKFYVHPFVQKDYLKWLEKNEMFSKYESLDYNPLISILIPTYNIERLYLSECLDSILNQTYSNFEICIADDCSTSKETIDTLKNYEKKDKRVKVIYRKENGHISKATNSALSIATGEFVMLMDNDDTINENALYEFVKVLNENHQYDLIYSDEDKIDIDGKRCEPHFKPDYSPDTLYGGNYLCHLVLMRTSILRAIGGEKSEYVGAQDFDLFLRYLEKTSSDRVYHISKILYHWRKIPGSTADTVDNKEYAINNGKKAVIDALKRKNIVADVYTPIKTTQYIIEYKVKKNYKISVIILADKRCKNLLTCLNALYKRTVDDDKEVIIVNNYSNNNQLLKNVKKQFANLKVIDCYSETNISKLHNIALKQITGNYVMFLNQHTEIKTDNFVQTMVGYASQSHIGAVGIKTLSSNMFIKQAGIILGVGAVASYSGHNYLNSSYGFYGRLLVPYDYSVVSSECMVVDVNKLKEIGCFDENLHDFYYNIDICLKLLNCKYYNVVLPHIEAFSHNIIDYEYGIKKFKKTQSDLNYLKSKWKSKLKIDSFYNPNFSIKYPFMLDKEVECKYEK